MPGFKARLVKFLIVHRHWFQGKLNKPVFDTNTSITGFRDQCEKGASRFGKVPPGVSVQPLEIDGIRAEWIVPDGAPRNRAILYVHGGGYVSGSCNDHRGIVAKLAMKAGFAFLVYEYRLAPEHPFPAAVEDSVTVWQWLLHNGFQPGDLLIMGESAGGGLSLALLMALKERNLSMPAAAVAISPWTDLTCSDESYRTRNRRSAAPLDSWIVFGNHYAGGKPKDLPLMSPLFGNPAGFPPLLINAGEDDELFGDGEKFAQKAKAAGVDVTFRGGPGMIHCYPLLAPMFPEATRALDEIIDFIKRHLE